MKIIKPWVTQLKHLYEAATDDEKPEAAIATQLGCLGIVLLGFSSASLFYALARLMLSF